MMALDDMKLVLMVARRDEPETRMHILHRFTFTRDNPFQDWDWEGFIDDIESAIDKQVQANEAD